MKNSIIMNVRCPMKRLLLLLLLCIFICGCAKEETIVEEKKDEEQQEEVVEVIPTYEDLNTTPIGIYQLQGNTLTRLHEIHKTLNIEEDIGIFQVYPSNEEVIYLQDSFANSFYQKFQVILHIVIKYEIVKKL